ncbi:M61 family metallopeptidase [Ferrimonas sediminicola]|uniref:M61 family metallopeptidase n=1 Tax=Ferrimonas sediminicola TaxID=2569538 RepID=A0A4U1BE54_9GAMM|nr:PDZ domain-containing protein [Ferrimonas sediminicola]TKB49449.1 M61 family metallopeptidase [Ferrimonas sediminicola]
MRFALCALTLAALPAAGQVQYRIDMTQPQHHQATVTARFPAAQPGHFEFQLPDWRTGRYQLLPLADGLRRVEVTDAGGRPLEVTKVARSRWRVTLPEATDVSVRYQLYANELGDRTRHIDDSHAYLDASATFVYNADLRDQPVSVFLSVPERWRSVSGMASPEPHRFTAANYDVLVDSPIETGLHSSQRFRQEGREYEAVFWGEGNYDERQIAEDLQKLVAEGGRLWGGYPFERYLFMIHATGGASGATEHLNSTVIQRPRYRFHKRKDYVGFLSLTAHEFIHTWNVKAYRPRGLVPYDYQGENYTRLLWLAEGATSYFQKQLLLPAGLISVEEFLEDLAGRIERSEARPGRQVQSVAEASFDNWIATGGDYARNHSVNIYSEGYLASLSLDLEMIRRSEARHSFRDLHRYLYEHHRLPLGFDEQDVLTGLKEITGEDFSGWWQQTIDTPFEPDFDAMLTQLGLERVPQQQPDRAELGLELKEERGLARVTHVRRDGPAWRAGLTTADCLVAIDGMRLRPDQWQDRLGEMAVGRPVVLTLFRRDRLIELKVTPTSTPADALKLRPLAGASTAQRRAFEAWAGVAWPAEPAR